MSANCVCCASEIPEGQSICSMCYGDIDYGADGIYRQQWQADEERRLAAAERESEE